VFTGTPDGSDLWKRYRCAFDHYIDAKNMPSLELAKLLRTMEIDIAIDLSGHTEGTRLDVLAYRPAPIQITYLGFPGTLGLSFIDYLIADPITIPPELQKHYREKILNLPHCYLPIDSTVKPSPITPNRSDFDLPEESIILCSFNHDYKISPYIFNVWMEILKEIPNSVLWLMKLNDIAENNLINEAIKLGVDKKRIIFAKRLSSIDEHLARYKLANIFLDTFPYNGHTTVSDALLSGLNVITISGNTFSSRVASSLLNEYRTNKTIATSIEDYKKIALMAIANNCKILINEQRKYTSIDKILEYL
jgi:predicted O-linked N-acetylglucosamine transferase (SPINDLY family)